MENEEIYREVIYVYKKPEFSEEKANELGIKRYIENLTESKQELVNSQQRKKDDCKLTSDIMDFTDMADLADSPLQKFGWKALSVIGKGVAAVGNTLNMATDDSLERVSKKIIEDCEKNINFGIHSLEDEQIAWFPARYKELFNSAINHNFSTVEEYQSYFDNLSPLCENLIQKMKIEMDHVHFFSVEEMDKLKEENKIRFINVRNFTSGQLLIKHPFMPNTYMGIETSENALFHIKMQCLSRIMQCLGATRVSGHAYVSENKQRQMDANGKISYASVDVNGSLSKSENEKYESDYILEDSFFGDFSEQSYEDAIREAKRVGLYEDFDIKNLLDQRNPEKQNKMTGRKVKIELTRELNESLDIAFGLQAAGFGMNGAYKDILETQRKVMFELEIEF
jgi:hypothetical protein